MIAQVDGNQCVVRVGDDVWPFDIDCRSDVARIVIDSQCYTLRPLGWREKRNLARYSHLSEAFLQHQFLRVSVADDTQGLPTAHEHREALSALARWLNAPDGKFGLPLDRQILAAVTLDVCRTMQLTPATFDALDAAEVEMLWHAGRAQRPTSTEDRVDSTPDATAADATTADGAAMTRIVVVNDRQKPEEAIAGNALEAGPNRQPATPSIDPYPSAAAFRVDALTDAPLLDKQKSAARIAPRSDVVTVKHSSKTTSTGANRFRFNLSSVSSVAMPSQVEADQVIHPAMALAESNASMARSSIIPVPIPIAALRNADILSDVPFANDRRTPHDNAQRPIASDRTRTNMFPRIASESLSEDTLRDDHWLTAFAERLDEAAKAGGIDLES
jgi:hypothetical protein